MLFDDPRISTLYSMASSEISVKIDSRAIPVFPVITTIRSMILPYASLRTVDELTNTGMLTQLFAETVTDEGLEITHAPVFSLVIVRICNVSDLRLVTLNR